MRILVALARAGNVSIEWLATGKKSDTAVDLERFREVLRAELATLREHNVKASDDQLLELTLAICQFEALAGRLPSPSDFKDEAAGADQNGGAPELDANMMRAAIRAALTTHPDADPEWTAEHAVFLYSHLAGLRLHGELPRGEKAILDAALRAARAGEFAPRPARLDAEALAAAVWATETFLARRRVTASVEARARCIAEIYAAILDEPTPRKDGESKLQERAIRLAEAAIRNIRLSV